MAGERRQARRIGSQREMGNETLEERMGKDGEQWRGARGLILFSISERGESDEREGSALRLQTKPVGHRTQACG